jgi:extradiol dioxygenase family protein
MTRPFHLALPVPSLEHINSFYIDLLGCTKGRSDTTWVDLNLFGHQVVFHKVPGIKLTPSYNPVDQHQVPVPHFGVVLTPQEWSALAERLKQANTKFIIEPYTRFKGEPGEQSTLFFADPVGYHLEFKAFADDSMMFET